MGAFGANGLRDYTRYSGLRGFLSLPQRGRVVAEGDRLDVLATLIEAYEGRHFPVDPPDPIAAIQFCMEQQGLGRKDLEPMIGSRARVAEVMNRKRSLSIDMIRRLHEQLGISAEVLIRPTRADEVA